MADDEAAKAIEVSTRTVSQLTTYQLRQELVKRNALDIHEENINYKSMLARLIKELVIEEQIKTDEKVSFITKTNEEVKEQEKKRREDLKRDAIERSKKRQSNPDYFLQKKQELATEQETLSGEENNNSSEENKTTTTTDDIFRSTPMGRSKVHTR